MLEFQFVKAVILDWAGTTVDFGSRAPATVFQNVFLERGVRITPAEAREPMGMAKREHIAAIAAMPRIAALWNSEFGRACNETDVDAMYADFLPMQKSVLAEYSDVIEGVAEAVEALRASGLKIGSSTGYTRELMEIVAPIAAEQGYRPDLFLCSEDAPRGRPAPYLIFEIAKQLDIYPTWHMVKVDDTTVGIEAGRNAGCWTVGVTRTGNLVGCSPSEWSELSEENQSALITNAEQKLNEAGAHFTLASVAELPQIIAEIDQRLQAGQKP